MAVRRLGESAMKKLEYQVSFTTPAFLGNAEQQAQWRTPPFKALIRQWWRVVKAQEVDYSVDVLRQTEGQLFGVAADGSGESRQSRVRLRLKGWAAGTLSNEKWPRAEIGNVDVGQGRSIPADVYIGYGPVLAASRKDGRPNPTLGRRAIDPAGGDNELRIGFARDTTGKQVAEIHDAITLANWFGGIGSRCRNGWGSVLFSGESLSRLPQSPSELQRYVRPLDRCLDLDWPHAIGEDKNGPLVWTGKPVRNWRDAVLALANARRAIRGAAKAFGRGQDISANQLIAYPVTQSGNRAWGDKERIAGSLRLKVLATDKGLLPLAVHLPCTVPAELMDKLSSEDQRWLVENQVKIWRAVHAILDERMTRFGGAK
jgi:CRISPR-associated protein Cmr1